MTAGLPQAGHSFKVHRSLTNWQSNKKYTFSRRVLYLVALTTLGNSSKKHEYKKCLKKSEYLIMGPKLYDEAPNGSKPTRQIWIFTWLRPKKVSMARTGAARAKTRRCLRMRFLSRPACIRNDTRPNAAGACRWQSSRVHIGSHWQCPAA